MRILSWNIQGGGGRRVTAIVNTLLSHDADALVLGEFHPKAKDRALLEQLTSSGYTFQATGAQRSNEDNITVLVASRLPFEQQPFDEPQNAEASAQFAHRAVRMRFGSFILIGIYFPPNMQQRSLFEYMLRHSATWLAQESMVIGDFNTGIHPIDAQGSRLPCEKEFAALSKAG